jgi:hypothetical protein
MLKSYLRTFSLVLAIAIVGPTKADYDSCKVLLNWVYRELTLNNLDKSYERAMNKMLLGLYTVHDNTKKSSKYKSHMAKIFNTLNAIDPELKEIIGKNKSLDRRVLWWKLPDQKLKIKNLQSVFKEWRNLQKRQPSLFDGLPKKYQLDSWDLLTVDTLSNLSQYKFTNTTLSSKFQNIGDKLKSASVNLLAGRDFNPKDLMIAINSGHKNLLDTLNQDYADILHDYRNICSQEDMQLVLGEEKIGCPVAKSYTGIESLGINLEQLQETIFDSNLLHTKDVTIGLTDKPNIPIHLLNYEVSSHPKVEFCERDPDLISMIVIHHTQTKTTSTPHDINILHLNKSTDDDPWYMVGYNYLISDTYKGATKKTPKVFQGRPPEIQGSHAGGRKFEISKENEEYYKGRTITCGGKKEYILDKIKRDKGLRGNFASYGIGVIGNYAPMTEVEIIAGVSSPLNLSPLKQETPSEGTIDAIAKLSCDLQKKNPRIKTIVPHSYFKSTGCPGNLVTILNKVVARANQLGCTFKVELKRKDGKWK